MRKQYDMGTYESCTYDEAKKQFDKCYYTLPDYDKWLKLDRMKHYNAHIGYQFKRPTNRKRIKL